MMKHTLSLGKRRSEVGSVGVEGKFHRVLWKPGSFQLPPLPPLGLILGSTVQDWGWSITSMLRQRVGEVEKDREECFLAF